MPVPNGPPGPSTSPQPLPLPVKRLPVSAVLITRNEEARLPEALASVAFCDDILVVDSGSTDRTPEIAFTWGARVVHCDWAGFTAQRNTAMELARHDWVLALDADERVSSALRASIEDALTNPRHTAYSCCRRNWYQGRWIRHGGWYPQRRTRLCHRDRARWVGGDLHEWLKADGPVGRLNGDLLHYPYRDLAHHLDTINRYTTIAATERFRQGRRTRWWRLITEPPLVGLKKYLLQAGFLDGLPGFLIAVSTAGYVLLKHAKLREMWRQSRMAGPGGANSFGSPWVQSGSAESTAPPQASPATGGAGSGGQTHSAGSSTAGNQRPASSRNGRNPWD